MSILVLTQVRQLLRLINDDLAPNWKSIADWQLRLCRAAHRLLSLLFVRFVFHFSLFLSFSYSFTFFFFSGYLLLLRCNNSYLWLHPMFPLNSTRAFLSFFLSLFLSFSLLAFFFLFVFSVWVWVVVFNDRRNLTFRELKRSYLRFFAFPRPSLLISKQIPVIIISHRSHQTLRIASPSSSTSSTAASSS